jgi:hypothetical protein
MWLPLHQLPHHLTRTRPHQQLTHCPCHLRVMLKFIHDGQFRHRIWASCWVWWGLDKSMMAWKCHGSR